MTAGLLAGFERMDASSRAGPSDIDAMTKRGQCFAATSDNAQSIYVLQVDNGICWVNAMQGRGNLDWIAHILPIIEAQAKGCKAVGFETKRRGLVKKAQKQGYRVTGWILKKDLP